MRNFTRVKFWLLLMVMGLMVSSAVAQTEPKVGITPDPLDLGEWPIGGWQENAYLELKVEGTGTVTINASELDDPEGVFTLTNPTLPVSVTALDPAVMIGVAFDGNGVAEQNYNATYVTSWGTGKSVTTSEITVFGYTPVTGDIFEDPFVVTLPHTDAGVSTALPMRSNYNIPGTATNGKDVVYKFTLAEDKEVTINLTNATETPKMAIYAADFEGEAGPMVSNAIASAGASATDLPLFAGDYYVVVSAEADDAAMTFDIEITATTMPDPECIVNPMPADGAVEVPSNGIVLSWEYGQYVQEYQLLFGTTYPPTDELMGWTAIDPAGDSYALPNLDPSMQYFWQVNVKNNNATITTCDVYGFTTTLTPPADLTAEVVKIEDDEYNVKLDWTASAKALLSYNVYRDGAKIATTPAGTNTYTDLDLAYNMDPCYEYTVEAIFDEGVSDMSNVATACITGVGMVDGTVTELLTGDPIEGAIVKLVGPKTYNLGTDADGKYSGKVVEGTYDYTVSKDGYITETKEDIDIDYNTTVTQDFELDEFPYPVTEVVAYDVNDNTVHVDWGNNGNPGGGGDPVEFRYDDGTATGQLGSQSGTTNTVLGNVHRVDAELTEMSWYLTAEGGPHANITIYVFGLDANGIPDGNNVLFSENVSNTDEEWNTFTFDTPIDATGGFFLGVAYNGFVGIGTDDGSGDPYEFTPNTHYFVGDYTAGGWETWETYDFEVNAMVRAMGVEGGKASYAVPVLDTKPNSDLTYIASESFFPGFPEYKTVAKNADKDLVGYNVYRGSCYSEDDFEFLGYTIDDQFTDNTWNDVDWGVYRWAVEAVYTNNASERAYSNCLDKDMEAVVNAIVTTNSGDAPEGCQVVFTNTSEPDLELSYELALDGLGQGTIDPFRKGIYNYTVTLPGFGEISANDVLVDSDTTFVWQLEELLAAPSDLYVTPTGFATWSAVATTPFDPFMADFNDGLPEGWEIINNGTSADDTWFWNDGTNGQYTETLDGTAYLFVDSDDAGSGVTLDEYLVSPVINTEGLAEVILEFDQFYRHLSGGEFAKVDVYDGSAWVNVLNQTDDYGSWSTPDHVTIDVSEHANADFRVRFHYFDDGGWKWHWAVDNVSVHDNAGKVASGKALQFYKVWHDDVFSDDRDTTFYQYGDMGEELVPGETYLAEVATLYSTGLSPRIDYEWTYLPCDSFPGHPFMDAYNVDGSDDVVVRWGDEGSSGGGDTFFDDFESYDDFDIVYSPWTTFDVDGAEPYGFQGVSFPNSAEPRAGIIFNPLNTTPALEGPLGVSGDKYLAIFNPMSPLVDADDWNITPQITIGDDYEVSFYATGGNANYSAEEFQVFVSTGDAIVADMVALSDQVTTPSGSVEWVKYTYDLSEYEGEDIYVGLHCTSYDQFFLCVDDFYVGPADNGKTADEAKLTVNVNEELWSTVYAKGEPKGESIAASTKSAKADPVVIGTNVYRDGEMIAFVPASDTFYVDMNLEPGYYDYCVATVYTEDDGAHTWTSCVDANCELDVLVPEDCNAPTNLTAEDLLGDGHTATLNWEHNAGGGGNATEFRYDDGTATGQLGSQSGTTNTVLGNVHRVDAELTEMSWYLTAEGGPHANITIYVFGLDADGIPDGNNVLFSENVSNTDEEWNTFTFDSPIDATGGFFLGVAYNGFVGIGTDDGAGDPYEFAPNTHYFVGDYTAGGWETWETYDFEVNAMVRAMGVEGGKASYAIADNNTAANGDLSYVTNANPVVTEGPKWSPALGTKEFVGYTVYRDDEEIVSGLTETTYADLLDAAGYHCYEVTAVYSVCGESDPSNEACVDVSVGINNIENNVSVYPNPAKDFVMVEASNDIRSIEVTNYMGQVVNAVKSVEMTQYRINTSDLSSGVYFVEVETTAGIEKVRIVISE